MRKLFFWDRDASLFCFTMLCAFLSLAAFRSVQFSILINLLVNYLTSKLAALSPPMICHVCDLCAEIYHRLAVVVCLHWAGLQDAAVLGTVIPQQASDTFKNTISVHDFSFVDRKCHYSQTKTNKHSCISFPFPLLYFYGRDPQHSVNACKS